jgi:transcriptional regulator with XRE-family HTH domain
MALKQGKKYTLQELITELRMTREEFAVDIDISRQSVSKWINGKAKIAISNRKFIEKKYGITLIV